MAGHNKCNKKLKFTVHGRLFFKLKFEQLNIRTTEVRTGPAMRDVAKRQRGPETRNKIQESLNPGP